VGKFLVAVVHPSDAERLSQALADAGYRATRIASTGGFLGGPSSTFFMAIEDTAEGPILEIFERTCSARDVQIPLVLHERLRDLPNLVRHSGAHVFILDLARHIQF
jgi:uncharacterized protein YaaQ